MRKIFLLILPFVSFVYSCDDPLKNSSKTTTENQLVSPSYLNENSDVIVYKDSSETSSIKVDDTFNITKVFEPKFEISITNETKSFKVDDFNFIVTWSDSLVFSKAYERFIPGIKKLVITKGKKVIQIFKNIPDEDAVGLIRFAAYDYNFDGNIDFKD